MDNLPLPIKVIIFIMLAFLLVKFFLIGRYFYRWWKTGKPEDINWQTGDPKHRDDDSYW